MIRILSEKASEVQEDALTVVGAVANAAKVGGVVYSLYPGVHVLFIPIQPNFLFLIARYPTNMMPLVIVFIDNSGRIRKVPHARGWPPSWGPQHDQCPFRWSSLTLPPVTPQVCTVAVGTIGDIVLAVGVKSSAISDRIVQSLLRSLQDKVCRIFWSTQYSEFSFFLTLFRPSRPTSSLLSCRVLVTSAPHWACTLSATYRTPFPCSNLPRPPLW
mgnify:CR=1 FL=1